MVALAPSTKTRSLVAFMPALFVVLWSTGFIGAKFGLPYAGPMTFLTLRFWLVAALMLPVALAAGAAWPRRPAELGHAVVVGLLIQFTYLGGAFPRGDNIAANYHFADGGQIARNRIHRRIHHADVDADNRPARV